MSSNFLRMVIYGFLFMFAMSHWPSPIHALIAGFCLFVVLISAHCWIEE